MVNNKIKNDFPKIAIIILNWNGLEDMVECLESVKKIDYSNYEVIVVDNGSSDDSPDQVKKLFPEVTLIRNSENLGFAGGNNVGIRHAMRNGAQYIWLLNNDTVIEPDSLTKLISREESNPKIGLLSPIIYSYSDPSKMQFCGAYFNWKSRSFSHPKEVDELKEPQGKLWLWGTALLIKREVVEKIGYLNEKYFAYCEDAEYSLRVLKAGYLNMVETTATIYHKQQYDDNGIANRKLPAYYFYYMTRNKYWLWQKNMKWLDMFTFKIKYLEDTIRKVASYKEIGYPTESITAVLDGLYCAFLNIGGIWDGRIHMPIIIKKIIMWHPYFLADLLGFNYKTIVESIVKKLKRKAYYESTNVYSE